MSSIESFSGQIVNLRHPHRATLNLTDVAHHLSNICRYNGACEVFYSVAEHAVHVSRYLRREGAPPETQWLGLHHDSPEAYIGDVTRPLKKIIGRYYGTLTARFEAELEAGLALPPTSDAARQCVRQADDWAMEWERYFLMSSRGENGSWPDRRFYEPEDDPCPPPCWPPITAKRIFLKTHHALRAETWVASNPPRAKL